MRASRDRVLSCAVKQTTLQSTRRELETTVRRTYKKGEKKEKMFCILAGPQLKSLVCPMNTRRERLANETVFLLAHGSRRQTYLRGEAYR